MNMRRPGSPPPFVESKFFTGTARAETLKSRENGFLVGAASKSAESHPGRNEDRYTATAKTIAIYDGMGGSDQGEKGAIMAKEEIESRLAKIPRQTSAEKLADELKKIIAQTSEKIYNQTEPKSDGTRKGSKDIGSTVSMLQIWEGPNGEKKAVIANVGDSRIYRLRNGELQQLTRDDGAPEQILELRSAQKKMAPEKKKKIEEAFNNFQDEKDLASLSDDEKGVVEEMFFYRNSVTQALGEKNVSPRTGIYDLLPGDEFIAMSDGIHDPFSDKKIKESLAKNPERSLTRKAQDLVAEVEEVNKAGVKRSNFDRNKYDDKTIVALKYEGTPEKDVYELDSDLAEMIVDDSDNTVIDISLEDLLKEGEEITLEDGDIIDITPKSAPKKRSIPPKIPRKAA